MTTEKERIKNCFLLSKTKQLKAMLVADSEEDTKRYNTARKRLIEWARGNVIGADRLTTKEIGSALDASLDAYADSVGEA